MTIKELVRELHNLVGTINDENGDVITFDTEVMLWDKGAIDEIAFVNQAIDWRDTLDGPVPIKDSVKVYITGSR